MDETRKSIILGQSGNQATEFICSKILRGSSTESDFPLDRYEALTKKIFEANLKLHKELIEAEEGDRVPPTQNRSQRPSLPPSPLQKRCPKCDVNIPKTWRTHKECGWSG